MQFLKDLTLITMVSYTNHWFIQKNMIHFIGKLFIKDFVDELEMQEIVLDEEEIQAISAFADAEGQVVYFIHPLTIQA